MEKVVFEKQVLTNSGTIISAIFATLAITCIIFIGIFLYTGADRSPDGIEEMMPYAGIATLIFSALGIYFYFKSKVLFQLIDLSNGKFKIKVDDPREKKVLQTPWDFDYGWEKYSVQRGAPKMKRLLLNFYQNNQCILQLKEERGAIHSAPKGWIESYSHFKTNLDPAKYKHTLYNASELEKVVQILESV